MNFFFFRFTEYLEVILSKISDKALTFSNKIYVTLMFFFSFVVIADYFLNYIFGGGPESEGYDLAFNYRFTSPSHSYDIVILDFY